MYESEQVAKVNADEIVKAVAKTYVLMHHALVAFDKGLEELKELLPELEVIRRSAEVSLGEALSRGANDRPE